MSQARASPPKDYKALGKCKTPRQYRAAWGLIDCSLWGCLLEGSWGRKWEEWERRNAGERGVWADAPVTSLDEVESR